MVGIANKFDLKHFEDKIGNIIIYKPAQNSTSPQTLLLQAHMDMVCEKDPESNHNFQTDPIKLIIEGDKIRADKTTLGADNGVGLCMILAVLEDRKISHPNLECLFTTDEETGMEGVLNLDTTLLSPTKYINLDTEEENCVYIGCAGSTDFEFIWKPVLISPQYSNFYTLKVEGLLGGHSGADIHLNRGNAVKILGQILMDLGEIENLNIQSINGGNLRNAIPRFASSVIDFEHTIDLNLMEKILQEKRAQLSGTEPDIKISLEKTQAQIGKVLNFTQTLQLINLINSVHFGVLEMSNEIAELVQTSNNFSSIKTAENGEISFVCMTRSCVNSSLKSAVRQILSPFIMLVGERLPNLCFKPYLETFNLNNSTLCVSSTTPGWNPVPNNDLLSLFHKKHLGETGIKADQLAIHAGLECGVLSKYYPNLDIISFGPTIREAHTPNEYTSIKSIDNCFKLLVSVINDI